MAKKKVPAAKATKDLNPDEVEIVPEEEKDPGSSAPDKFDELLAAEVKETPVQRVPVEIDAKTLIDAAAVEAAEASVELLGDWTLRFSNPPAEDQEQKVTLIFGHKDKSRLKGLLDVAIQAGAPGKLRMSGPLSVFLHAVRFNYLGIEDGLHKEALIYVFRARAIQ